MKVLHLAAGNRWTGAAAPAFAEVEALRAAGVDAHYAYVGGYKLEVKLGRYDFAHPLIEKSQNPIAFARSKAAIDRMVARHGFDVIHTHLTHDHWLARFVTRETRIRLARTFHSRRVLRTDVLTKSLIHRTELLFVINDEFRDAPALARRTAIFTPPPLDHRQFTATGPNARALQGIDADEKIVTVIGKLSKGRGFEDALRTFALLRKRVACRLMIIGHGEHRPALELLAAELEITEGVVWAGYHEDDLAEHYRASDLLLFTAKGSDEGHRAVLEAMACGVPPATFPIEGVAALTGPAHVAAEPTPEALAALAETLLAQDLRESVVERSMLFGYEAAAQRLIAAY
ncbi:MAG TPA: glycosyltransferase family 4 protein [Thermoanaerobaculia bacterium]